MNYAITRMPPDELYHHGIKGQKWGVRRYQNADGTWTTAGKERYGSDKEQRKLAKKVGKSADALFGEHGSFRKDQKYTNKVRSTAQFKNAVDRVKETASALKAVEKEEKQMFDGFKKDKKSFERWTLELAKYRAEHNKNKSVDEWTKFIRSDEDSIDTAYIWYSHRDPKASSKRESIVQKRNEIAKEHDKNCDAVARDLLGKYADRPAGKTEKRARDSGRDWYVSNAEYLSGIISRGYN